ncbi:MAG: carboxypeptidase-like regulatory domain-containing protein [Caldisericia bacterium]|jgi:uncharacterized membrane protein|nr:carboxypeptidase-like regulatory domain-containing protein [Caldisericia bacterium]
MKNFKILLILILVFSLITIYGCKKEVKTSEILVTVIDNEGKPVQDVNLSLDGKSGKTDSQGKYTFSNIDFGKYKIRATKEEFEDFEDEIEISSAEKKEIKIVLNKKSEFEEIKNYSDIESFHVIAEFRTKEATSDQRIELITENFGKREYMKVTNLNTGELYTEIYSDEKIAKIRYSEKGEFYEMPREQIGSISESFHSLVNEYAKGIKDAFNQRIKIPQGSLEYSVRKIGTEKVNNYMTTKYEFRDEVIYQNEKTKVLYEIWVINSGKYKNFPTKLNAIMTFQDGSMLSYTINIFELGEAKIPKF